MKYEVKFVVKFSVWAKKINAIRRRQSNDFLNDRQKSAESKPPKPEMKLKFQGLARRSSANR